MIDSIIVMNVKKVRVIAKYALCSQDTTEDISVINFNENLYSTHVYY